MHASNQRRSYVSILKKGKTDPVSELNSSPALVLDESCILKNDRKLSLMGKVKDFGSIPNLYFLLAKEGFYDLKLSYLGANPKFISDERVVWVDIEWISLHARTTNTLLHARTTNTFKKIGSKWGEVLDTENSDQTSLYQKRLCVKTKETSFILEIFKVIVQGKMYWIRAKEVKGWTPIFQEEKTDYSSSNEESMRVRLEEKIGEHEKGNSEANESDVERVSESSCMQGDKHMHKLQEANEKMGDTNVHSKDPFKIYELLN
ncbi:hypothetical protein Tco_0480523 [Tanacetum coccineum]